LSDIFGAPTDRESSELSESDVVGAVRCAAAASAWQEAQENGSTTSTVVDMVASRSLSEMTSGATTFTLGSIPA